MRLHLQFFSCLSIIISMILMTLTTIIIIIDIYYGVNNTNGNNMGVHLCYSSTLAR